MQLCKVKRATGEIQAGELVGDRVRLFGPEQTISSILHADNPAGLVRTLLAGEVALAEVTLLPPLDAQEVWAAGVTYKRSREAREQESAGAAQFYNLVYKADRPELFLKATPRRVVGPNAPVQIRQDSKWNVPEPEITLVVNPQMKIVGYTIGNDMSSRDIEGENPLYLPQAKVYNGSCALGPVVTLAEAMPPREQIGMRLAIRRGGQEVFQGSTGVSAMARTFEDLVSWLGRDNSFPDGVILLTGTGIVPPDHFTLDHGDEVAIEIDGIGRLVNVVK
jgi:2-dehydro-3-deoxy-D-arabinonate dehydratase